MTLRQLRESAGQTQEQLARAVNVSVRSVGGWESGRRPKPWIVQVLAKHFGVKVSEIEWPEKEASHGE